MVVMVVIVVWCDFVVVFVVCGEVVCFCLDGRWFVVDGL